jgi:hypothetical protein
MTAVLPLPVLLELNANSTWKLRGRKLKPAPMVAHKDQAATAE